MLPLHSCQRKLRVWWSARGAIVKTYLEACFETQGFDARTHSEHGLS